MDPPEFVPVVSSGPWVETPGAESRPKITVTGTGDITLEIIAPRIEGKHQIISIESLEEGIVIDSERMICTGIGPLPELLNNKVEMDRFPVLYEGTKVCYSCDGWDVFSCPLGKRLNQNSKPMTS